MNKYASVKVYTRGGLAINAVITSEQMAQIGISMGWIKPLGEYGTKLASSIDKSGNKVFIKVASNARKFKMNLSTWIDLSVKNGWIMEDLNKVAGFWSSVGDLAGSAVNAVGNAWEGTKNLAGQAWEGAKQVGSNVARAGADLVGSAANAAQAAGKYVVDATGRVYDATGRAINATANAAGQVVDATGKVIGQAAKAGVRAAGDLAASTANAARQVGQFYVNATGQVVNAAGQAVNAYVNAAGQVVDAAGKVIGQAAQYAGQLAGEAKQAYDARRAAGDTNFMQAGGQLVANSPVGLAAQGVYQGGKAIGQAAMQAGQDVAKGYQQARAANAPQQQGQQGSPPPLLARASVQGNSPAAKFIQDYYKNFA